uniref:ATP synthase CF0 subunit B n=1 Tax=Bangiopsis subsimplex TaxID=139980 RepID=A0A1C9CCV7_9RHOD|nr:ATP synthase CFO B chain subunit I [Bangiopsis subsimplex]AOM66202.1 ATP synthase CFO B chain subunit I [Bangiopsis subsimplex]ARO90437.1 ATP synthase CF0 subunit B [Bangiopsis subsimplex]
MQYFKGITQFFMLISEEHIHSQSFGLNLNVLDTNIINLAILLSLLFYVGKQAISSILEGRQQKVLNSLQEAEERQQQASTRLKEAQTQLAQTQLIISEIKKEAESTAQQVRESTFNQGKLDIERLVASGKASIITAEMQVKKKLLQQVASLALERVSTQLKSEISSEMQSNIIDENIASLGGSL